MYFLYVAAELLKVGTADLVKGIYKSPQEVLMAIALAQLCFRITEALCTLNHSVLKCYNLVTRNHK